LTVTAPRTRVGTPNETSELAPLLYPNLSLFHTVAGEWQDFDVGWIESGILAGRHRSIRKWWRVLDRMAARRIRRWIRNHYWYRVRAFLNSAPAD
jgi:hypothetical protein